MTSNEPISGRCNAQTRDGGYCTQYPVTGAKRCRMHGGTNNQKGENNSQYEHGLYAEVGVDEAERELIDSAATLDELEKHDMLIDYELARFVRATGLINEPELKDIIREASDGPEKVGEKLDMNDGPLAARASLISSLLDNRSKDKHRDAKIDDGVKQRVETSMDDDSQAALLDAVGSLGDGDDGGGDE